MRTSQNVEPDEPLAVTFRKESENVARIEVASPKVFGEILDILHDAYDKFGEDFHAQTGVRKKPLDQVCRKLFAASEGQQRILFLSPHELRIISTVVEEHARYLPALLDVDHYPEILAQSLTPDDFHG